MDVPRLPRALLAAAAAAAVLLAACTDGAAPSAPSPEATGEEPDREAPADLTELTRDDLRTVLSPDSIPSIDDPRFIDPEDASEWLEAQEPVAVLVIDEDARAYPLQIMTWHEIVNDVVGGEPVAVTYCPLCNSALAYPRTVDGQVLEFGTSGSLYNSALVMFDRQTESLWLHFEGLAIDGPLEGTRLEFIPVQILSFEQFREERPEGRVLSRDTGHRRDYGQNPYALYDTNQSPFLFDGEVDDRLDAISRVVGVEIGGEPVAYPYELLSVVGGASAVHDTVGGEDIVVLWKAGVRSALDEPRIDRGRDVGSSGVFRPEAGGRALTFRADNERIEDEQTGSTWSLSGRATSGPLAGQELERVSHLDTFWFAWSSHKPTTRIFER
jgi:hypothetical protein